MSVSLFGSLLLLAGCALAQLPADNCCMPNRHQGSYSENSLEGNILTATTKAYNVYDFFYDFNRKYLVVDHANATNPDKNMTYYDYNTEIAYDYYLDGTCTSRTLQRRMRRPCEQPGSERWQTGYYLGFTPQDAKNSFSVTESRSAAGFDLFLYDIWSYNCDLLFEIETFKSNNYPFDFGYYSQNFFNIRPGITDDSVFDIPAVCLA